MDTARAVLIVDDDPSVLETMRVLLEGRAGFRVLTALGARGAARRLQGLDRLDVLVLDVDMFDDGAGAALCQTAMRGHPDVALVAMSSDGQGAMVPPASAALLPKPFGAHDLLAAIEDAGRRARARREDVAIR
ncbi:MAG TPA: response regulator [Dyella sp.]|nr:response regulator [Dyella sp.]